jgi:hypothetical protein
LQEYSVHPAENWKSKDNAIYLFTAVATRASTVQVCDKFLDFEVYAT